MNKLKHKLLSVFIAIAMVVSLVPLGGIKVSAASPNPWGYTTAYAGGAGTSGDPYQINTAAQLAFLAQQVNGGIDTTGVNYVLTSDIDLSGHDWTPIGYTSSSKGNPDIPFTGNFDGAGHKVTGLGIGTITPFSELDAGLFGLVDTSGSITNLGINTSINLGNNCRFAGGLVGYNKGSITNCYVTGTLTNSATIYDYLLIGGLMGENYGTITNCHSAATVIGGICYEAGGLAGDSDEGNGAGIILNSYATGNVSAGDNATVGGFLGWGNSAITNCYTTGSVTGGNQAYVGGFTGSSEDGSNLSSTNCYATGNVTGGDYAMVGGFTGYCFDVIINCYATGNVTGGDHATVGRFFGSDYVNAVINNSYWNNNAVQTENGVLIDATYGMGSEYSLNSTITSMSASEMASAAFAATLTSNRTDTATQAAWKHVSIKNQGFPVLLNVGDGIPEAPLLTTSAATGSAVGATKATATPGAGNTLAIFVSATSIATPYVGDSLPTGYAAYTSGSDISGVSAGKYLGVYEVDSSNKIVKFKLITLASGDIKAADAPATPPAPVAPTVTPATKVDITPQVVQSTGSAVVTVNKADIKKDATNVITPTVTSDTTTVETRIDVAAIAGGTGSLEFKSGSSDVVLPIGAVDLTGAGEGSYLSIKQSVSKDDTLVKTITGVSKAFEFTAATYDKNGNKIKDIHEFLGGNKVKITIQLTAADIKGLDTSKFAAFYYNETTKLYENLGGTYDSATMTFTFETTHFSKYVLGQANTSGAILPKTGSMIDMNLVLVLGLVMMALGSVLVLRKKSTSM